MLSPIRIGINGAGRIGRLVIRYASLIPDIQITCINDTMDIKTLHYLLRYDSFHLKYDRQLDIVEGALVMNGQKIAVTHYARPSDIPWKNYEVDIVIESTGKFCHFKQLEDHLKNGAQYVLLSCPAKDENVKTIIIGLNDNEMNTASQIYSLASCTANAVAPMLYVLHKHLGIRSAFMTTIHPFTNNQSIIDAPHPDPRRSRSLANNIIPTHSTAVPAIRSVFPHLKDVFHGIAIRVPTAIGAFVELICQVQQSTNEQYINNLFYDYSQTSLRGILAFCSDEIVSSDIINNPHSCIFDSLLTRNLSENHLYVAGWYDNEAGYAHRVIDAIQKLSRMIRNSL